MRTLRAVLWLRWRLVYNGLRSGRRRGKLETLSRAADVLVPIMLIFMIVPSSIVTAVFGYLGGWYLGSGTGPTGRPESLLAILVLLRVLLAGVLVLTLLIPLVRSVRGMGGSFTRFLLLPMSTGILHGAEIVSVFTDPWIFVISPGLLCIAAGFLASGAFAAGGIVFVSGVAFLVILASIGTLATTILHLMFRNRRRGEWLSLVVALLLSCSGAFWMFFFNGPIELKLREQRDRDRASVAAGEAPANPVLEMPGWTALVPSELYTRVVWQASQGDLAGSGAGLLGLAGLATVLFTLSARVYRRLLETPAISGARSTGRRRVVRLWRLPGLTPGATAVASALVRTVLRTVRGKMAVFFSPLILLTIGVVMKRSHPDLEEGFRIAPLSLWVALLGVPFSMLSLQMVHLNTFAIDGAGLTLQLLSPLSDRDLARGKAAGGAVLSGLTLLLFFIAALLAGPGGSGWLWACVPLGALSAWALYSPVAVLLSAIFPKQADLGRIGRGGNPHSLSGLLGMFATPFLLGPPALIVGIAGFWKGSPAIAFGLLAVWAVLSVAAGYLGVNLAARAIGPRRENLALVAGGR